MQRVTSGSMSRALISTYTVARVPTTSSVSRSVGIGVPSESGNLASSLADRSAIARCAGRCGCLAWTIRSWCTTTTPSRVACTSSSMPSAPSSIARTNAAIEFSGWVWCAPRWEILSGDRVVGLRSVIPLGSSFVLDEREAMSTRERGQSALTRRGLGRLPDEAP